MNCSLSYSSARVLPSPFHSSCKFHSTPIALKGKQQPTVLSQNHENQERLLVQKSSLYREGGLKPTNQFWCQKTASLAIQVGAFLAAVEQPALAVTGVNNEEDLSWKLIQLGIVAFWYLLIMPPILLNWLRLRWYKRMLLEMYLQFMCVFLFFPGILLWAPFVNFRRLPRDPTMKYPWSTPQDP
ncbi:NAD(P)H-quinone oxidoreductase subunit L protein [Thalictrum thalictroides]|uniref:NAD(P)H-quinone oxidoreductase subunit L protein n=1 Tax=Thalictrum thalictroides TaxID=46969 RepID=A0A7J6XG40_THATH|nr:NAD(P)H-quinone oxidoreductase subunit L protein [Thalictrum thalictroides]